MTTVANALSGQMNTLRRADPERRAQLAHAMYQQLIEVQAEVVAERRRAVREMREEGMTLLDIAHKLGVTLGRVKQIEEGPRKPTPAQRVARLETQLAKAREVAS